MVERTHLGELRKEVEGLKDQITNTAGIQEQMRLSTKRSEKAIEELRAMITLLLTNHDHNRENALHQEPNALHQEPTQPILGEQNLQGDIPVVTQFSRIEFHRFFGEDLEGWIFKYEQFFDVAKTPLNLRVKLASIHLEGEALQWHQVFLKSRLTMTLPTWEEYIQAMNERFGSEMGKDPMIELMHLRQNGSVQDYWREFDELVNRVQLAPNYAVSCFIGGLRDDIATRVEAFDPKSLLDTARITTLLERNYNIRHNMKAGTTRSNFFGTRNSTSIRNAPTTTAQTPILALPPTRNQPSTNKGGPVRARRLTPQEMGERRAKGLCFNCNEKFTPGHQCKFPRRQLFVMDVKEVEEESEDILEEDEVELIAEEHQETTNFQLSTTSSHGFPSFQTMRLTGNSKGKALHIFINPGATHNFLDIDYAKRLGCKLENTTPFSVTIAGGQKLLGNYICKSFSWKLQGIEFKSDIMTIPLSECDLVLGVQWLVTLGDTLFNYEQLRMEFFVDGKRIVLRGQKVKKPKFINGRKMGKVLSKMGQISLISLGFFQKEGNLKPTLFSLQLNEETNYSELDELLKTHSDLFEEPKALLPPRKQDYRILLKEGTQPINVRPYRYPSLQKNEIENIVKEILD
ncbi:hypothetical protein CDL12_05681 [Handroanthus impetiginosus]|uniref:Retrotransposon gag domain-containing protein n=1 Tax=Handroanthus impetiginosus TaxID=429701 RepID=A0A2G9HVR3_9LAMI|nr:hypothetical protein CDL12_05681 [Handroanthus impetiginosus]